MEKFKDITAENVVLGSQKVKFQIFIVRVLSVKYATS